MAIVYLTTNLINGKKYIGSTTRTDKDVKYYLGSGVNISLAIKKYGRENFIRETLWEGSNEHVREIEAFYCQLNDVASNQNYYNCTNEGTGIQAGVKFSDERKLEMSKVRKGKTQSKKWIENRTESQKQTIKENGFWSDKFKKPITLIDPNGNKHTFNSHKEARTKLKIQPSRLAQLKKGEIKWGKWLNWQYVSSS